jgi:hypothetical protein
VIHPVLSSKTKQPVTTKQQQKTENLEA